MITAPADLVIRKWPTLRIRQPNVMFFRDRRAGFRVREDPDRLLADSLAPDLAIEILSPGQDERTLAETLGDYASIAIDEVWFLDQEAREVRVLALKGAGYRLEGTFRSSERVVSSVLPGLELMVEAIFG